MSDLFKTRQKVEEGAQWRGTVTITVDGEQQELHIRQLRDPEFWDVMSKVDTDELQNLQSSLPEDKMEKFRELQNADNLTDEEKDRLEELQEEVEKEDIDIFDSLSYETYQGLLQAAKYAVEPDQSDIRDALTQHAGEIDEKYGGTSDEEARQFINEQVIEPMVERSTNFTSFALGVKALGETLGDSGNSES